MRDGFEFIDYEAVPDGTRLTMPDGRSYIVARDPLGWPMMLFEANGEWLHALDPLGPSSGPLLNEGPVENPPTWDDVTPRCCSIHMRTVR